MTIPNLLTLLRILLVPVFVSQLYYQYFDWALATFFLAGASDAVDGFIARRFNQSSELGKVLDPIADKLMMTTAFIVLAMPQLVPHSRNLPVPFWLTAAVITRDVLIMVVAGAIFFTTGFRRFRPSIWGKLSTTIQACAVLLILVATNFPFVGDFYLPFVYLIVFLFAAISGLHYIFFVSNLMKDEGI
ncbi:MAG: CDP-alcohol phosphatidyltransferase family protein [Pyrinomonadaceae bacterium]